MTDWNLKGVCSLFGYMIYLSNLSGYLVECVLVIWKIDRYIVMDATVVCKQGKYESQGYLFWSFGFYYKCPKCGHSCSDTKYCGECGTKIEYPHKPENFELYEFNGEWRYKK